MSDAIETGALRKKRSTPKPDAEAISEKRKIDRSQDELELGRFSGKTSPIAKSEKTATSKTSPSDELELGRFTGKTHDDVRPKKVIEPKAKAPEPGEVVGPMRREVDSDHSKAKRRKKVGTDMEIALTRDVRDDAQPSRPRTKRRTHSPARSKKSGSSIGIGMLILFGVILVVLTAATFTLMPRYQILGEPLLTEAAFEEGLLGWDQAGQISQDPDRPTRVTLESTDPDERTFLVRDIDLPAGDTLLVLRAQVQGENIQPGLEFWEQGRIYLGQLSAGGEVLWQEDHNLFLMNGTTDLRNYSRAFSVSEEIQFARLGIELKNATGRMTVSSFSLEAAERPLPFLIVAGILILAWSTLLFYAAARTLKGIQSTPIRLWLGATVILSIFALMLPGYFYEAQLQQIADRFGLENLSFDGIGHAAMFAILAFLVRLGRPQNPLWLHAGIWVFIGVASEMLQLFSVDREPSVIDLGLDGIGILIGLALAEVGQLMRKFRMA